MDHKECSGPHYVIEEDLDQALDNFLRETSEEISKLTEQIRYVLLTDLQAILLTGDASAMVGNSPLHGNCPECGVEVLVMIDHLPRLTRCPHCNEFMYQILDPSDELEIEFIPEDEVEEDDNEIQYSAAV